MVFFNHATRQMTVKIVYYGPGLCGKTTNLNTIYGKTSQKARGEMVSLNTETDRTLFFDLLPMDVGMVSGFKTKLQLYTVPGQVFYNSTRKLVLKGVDGVVFVVDSQTAMLDACKESYQNLEENLRELGLNLEEIPTVFQWNKRDLRNVVPIDELEAAFNLKGTPSFQSVASDGQGVFETLRGITKLALSHIKTHVLGETHPAAAPAAEPSHPAPAPPEPPPSGVAALTLSDLPSVTDLLDMEPAAAPAPSPGGAPLAAPLADDDDDSGIFIEAPVLPEPPEPAADDIAFLMEEDAAPAPAPEPEPESLPVAGISALDRAFEASPEAPLPEAASPSPDIPEAPPATLPEEAPVAAVEAVAVPPARPAEPEGGTSPSQAGPAPVVPAVKAPPPSRPAPKVDPLAALASLKVETRRSAPKPKAVDHKDAISSLLGELTLAGRSGLPSVLRLDLPTDLEGQELEVVVQVRREGQVLLEGTVQRPMPGKGSTTKLSVEFKRA